MTRFLRWAALAAAIALGAGCDDPVCPPEESFLVEATGTCAATPQRFTISSQSCRVSIDAAQQVTGLPRTGALAQQPAPLRQGGFILYGGDSPFRLCRARRVDFRLEIACVDGSGAPACEAVLTEPTR